MHHQVIEGTKFCQKCLLWLPAIDVIPEWTDCPNDRFRMRKIDADARSADATLEPRIRATDTNTKPQLADYERWNCKLIK